MQRETMEYDVVIVGGGPAGLSAAIRLRQLAVEQDRELSVCLLEKGAEIGAHILSGAAIEPRALNELFPDWKERNAPLDTPVVQDEVYLFTSLQGSIKIPHVFTPGPMYNKGNYIVSLGNLCRWLAEQAEALEVEIFPGFAGAEVLFNEDGSVRGVATGDMGINAEGQQKSSFEPGIELHAKYTIFAEGSRGHLGKQLIANYHLDKDSQPQHYAIGLKELWEIKPEMHKPGLVIHGTGWPLSESKSSGGFFLYHLEDNQVVVGLIVDLNYTNPYVAPFEEFQRFKHHPKIKQYLTGGSRISYGARAITKGGINALPKTTLPGALIIGCDAGTLNFSKIKGTHTAMKSGMLAAEAVIDALMEGNKAHQDLIQYQDKINNSWLYEELYKSRNFGAALHKWGTWLGGAFNLIEQNLFRGNSPFQLKDPQPDHEQLKPANESKKIDYPTPDGKITFDKLSSVFLSSTNHEEDQPCHLTLNDSSVPIEINLKLYDAPEQRYCPAGVYEIVEEDGEPKLQINAQNCIHCKTCDIKDPTQNITWVVPEGTGGPNYPNM